MKKKRKKKSDNPVFVGVAVIAIIFFIGAAISGFFGALSFLSSFYISSNPDNFFGPTTVKQTIFAFRTVGIILSISSAFSIALGVFLLLKKNWARIICLVVASIGLVFSLVGLIQGEVLNLLGLVSNGFIVYFLSLKETKAYFK